MKRYIIIFAIIPIFFVACKKRDDYICRFHNFSVPENLSFDIDCQTLLIDGDFNANILDSSKMQRLDREATIQLMLIEDKLHGRDLFENDSVFSIRCENTHLYIYGKLDLQPYVNSFVLWRFNQDIYHNVYHTKSMELVNMKDNKLCSLVTLDARPPEILITNVLAQTYLRDKRFTTIYKWTSPDSFWENIRTWVGGGEKDFYTHYTHYQVNENGFIEFVND